VLSRSGLGSIEKLYKNSEADRSCVIPKEPIFLEWHRSLIGVFGLW
jgi:hypothetical protein